MTIINWMEEIDALKKLSGVKDSKRMNAEEQLNRLLGRVWRNPFDVLLLDMSASDDDIRKQYKQVAGV